MSAQQQDLFPDDPMLAIAGGWQAAAAWLRSRGITTYVRRYKIHDLHNVNAREAVLETVARVALGFEVAP